MRFQHKHNRGWAIVLLIALVLFAGCATLLPLLIHPRKPQDLFLRLTKAKVRIQLGSKSLTQYARLPEPRKSHIRLPQSAPALRRWRD